MDDFYNDSFGDQCLMELDIINTVSTVTDTISEPVSPAKNITVNNQLPEENTPSIPRIPDHFIDFPYPKPYTQQLELMQTVYKTLETTSCGVFESPTGTGKSLSLLTASLRWLLDYNTKQLMRLDHLQGQMKSMTTSNDNNKENNNTTVDDWIKDFEVNRQLKRQIEPQIEDLIVYQSSLQLIEKIKLTKTPSSSLSALQLTDPPSKVKQPESTSETVDVEKLENFIKVTNEEDCDALDADDDLFLCEQKPEVEQFKLLEDIDELNASENEFDQYSKIKQQPDNGLLRIIYCSRTHSQLGQIAKEFNKCKSLFDKVTMIQLSSRYLLCTNQQVYELKHSDLINIACLELNRPRNRDEKQIKKFKCPMHNLSAINNLANYLLVGSSSAMDVTSIIRNNQETKPSRTLKPMNSNKNSLNNRRKDHTEDLQLLDSHIGCPYYANRKGIPLAQLILVPYSLLLQSSSRSTSGLKLKNSIIIIDEAHNLLDAMASSMSVNLLLINDLYRLEELFTDYLNYYRSRLSTFLALRLRQMKHFLHQLKAYLNNIHKNMLKTSMSADSFMMTSSNNIIIKTVNQLYSESNLDNINVSEFIDCLEYQHFIMKLIGFSKWSNRRIKQTNSSSNSQLTNILASMKRKYPGDDKRQLEDVNQVNIANKRCKMDIEKSEGIGSSLFKFHRFLQALAQCEEDARIVIELFKNSTKADDIKTSESGLPTSSNVNNTKDNQDLCISIIFLNPGRYLKELVQEARCVLLVGGTMQPFTEAIEQIFLPAGKLTSQIVTFACDHVIDAKTQLAVYPLGENCQTDGKVLSLDFTYQKRSNPKIMDACGNIILEICQQLPAGIVVFTPSYEYQSILYQHWETTGLLNKLTKYKSLFHEPKSTATLDQIMQAYGVAAKQKLQHRQGALLLCVIGGKLSEGINFTDDLARVVVIIGMPYANPQSPILREKMAYLDRHFSDKLSSGIPQQPIQNPGRRYYEAMCMRSINQAIGRSVRHGKDYAVVFLLDNRYYRPTVQSQLPKWVQQSVIRRTDDGKNSTTSSLSNQNKYLNLTEALANAKKFFELNRERFKEDVEL